MADGEIRIAVPIDLNDAEKQLKVLEKKAKDSAKAWDSHIIKLNTLEETQRRWTAEGGKSTAQMERMAERIAQAKDKAVVLENAFKDARESASAMSLAVKDMQFAQNERAAQALADAAERQKVSIDEVVEREMERQNAMQSTSDSIAQQEQQAAALNNSFVEMGKSAFEIKREFAETTMQPLRDDLDAARYQIAEMSAELKRLQAAGEAPKGIVGMQRTLEASSIELDKLEAKLSKATTFAEIDFGIRPETAAMMDAVLSGLKDIAGGVAEVGERAGMSAGQMDAIPAAMNKTAAAANRQTSIFRELASVAASVGSALRKAFSGAASAVGSFVKRLPIIGSLFKGIYRDTRTATGGIERFGKRIFRLVAAALVFNQIRRALRSLIDYYGTAMKQNDQLNAAFARFKGAALTAFQPLFEVAMPALTTLVNWLATAIQHLATFTSMLFNVDPTKMQANAKAMWDNVKATKAGTKELQKFKAPFDELITLSEDAAAGADMSEIVPDFAWEPPAIAEWMQKLKNIFKEADFGYWFDLGASAAGRFSDALRNIPWDSIRAGARALGENLAGLLGGFLSDKDVWTTLGHTLAQGLNTALDFLHSFAVNFPWQETGLAIAAGINEFFATFDWALFGQTLSTWVIGFFTMISTAIKNVDWRKVGESIKTFLVNIDWKGIAKALFKTITAAFSGIVELFTSIFGEGMTAVALTFASGALIIVGALKGMEIVKGVTKLFGSLGKVLANIPAINKGAANSFEQVGGGAMLALAGIALLIKSVVDLIFNWGEMDGKQRALAIGMGILGAAAIALGTAIALGLSAATLGIGAIVAGVIAAVTAVTAFIVHLVTEEKAIKSVEQAANDLAEAEDNLVYATDEASRAQENYERATDNVVQAQERLEQAEMDVVSAKEALIRATEELTSLNNDYINSVERAEKTADALAEAEARLGISGEALAQQVAQGTLDFKDMDAAQREVYKAYMDNAMAQDKLNNTMTDFEQIQYNAEQAALNLEKAERDVEKASIDVEKSTREQELAQRELILREAELAEKIKERTAALWDNELAMAAQKKGFNQGKDAAKEYRDAVVDAFNKGELSAEEAQLAISKAMTGMSKDVRKTFTEDMPRDINEGLDPRAYETTGNKITNWFKNVANSMVGGFKGIFGIHSPSRVMIGISENLGDGLINGWKYRLGDIKNVTGKVYSAISGTFSNKSNDFKEIGGNLAGAIGAGISNTAGLIKSAFTDTIEGAGDDVDGMEGQGYSIGMSLLRGLELAYTPIVDFFRQLMSDIKSVISASLPTIPQITIPQLPRAGFLDSSTISAIAARGGQQGAAQASYDGGLSRQDVYAVVHDAILDALDASGRMDDIITAILRRREKRPDNQRLARETLNINNGRSQRLGATV